MTRLSRVVVFIAALAPSLPHAQTTPGVPLVIDAVAVDRAGLPVMDLKREDLEVWIAGYRVPIDRLTAVTSSDQRASRSVVLILDDLTVPLSIAPRVKEIARRFVERMAPGDEMSILTFEGQAAETTGDRQRLLEAIDAYYVRTAGVVRVDVLGEQVLGTVGSIARQLTTAEDRRKTVVAIGSAPLFDTPIPPPTVGRELRKEWTDTMRAMAFANVAFYVVDPGGLDQFGNRLAGNAGFARESGGVAFVNTNDFGGIVDRTMREAGNYYLIEVADPPVQRKADLRELDVRVRRSGVTLRARRAIPGTAPADPSR